MDQRFTLSCSVIQGELKAGEKLLHKVLQSWQGIFLQSGQGLFLCLLKLVVARLQLLHTLEIGRELIRRLDQVAHLRVWDGKHLVVGRAQVRSSILSSFCSATASTAL